MVNSDSSRRSRAYSIAEAARLVGVQTRTVRRWLYGDEHADHQMRPVLGPRPDSEGSLALSFLDLAELFVVAHFRRGSGRRMPLWRLRDAHDFARRRLGVDHPFASNQLLIEGGHILHEFARGNPGPRIALDRGGQYVLPVEFGDALSMFDFARDTMASKWYPAGRETPIVIDPHRAAGQPTIEGRNVRIDVLLGRKRAGWGIAEIAEDFSLDTDVVEAVLRVAAA